MAFEETFDISLSYVKIGESGVILVSIENSVDVSGFQFHMKQCNGENAQEGAGLHIPADGWNIVTDESIVGCVNIYGENISDGAYNIVTWESTDISCITLTGIVFPGDLHSGCVANAFTCCDDACTQAPTGIY